jgi:hypothetical protein
MRTTFAALLAAFAIVACAQKDEETSAPLPPPPSETVAAPSDDDACKASQYTHLIGKKKAEIPSAPAGASWRVTCTTCPVTMDFRADRLNIFFNEKTEVIEVVKCG